MAGEEKLINLDSNFIDKLNVKNAKIIALCLVAAFSALHAFRHLVYGRSFLNFSHKSAFKIVNNPFH